jgi:hypothetical protein
LHGLKERALHLGGSPVDLVRKNEVGEDWPFVNAEPTDLRVVYLRSEKVSGKQVRSELDSREIGLNRFCYGLHQKRLGQASHAFKQDVTVCQKADHEPLYQLVLTDDNLTNLAHQSLQQIGLLGDLLVDVLYAGKIRHGLSSCT